MKIYKDILTGDELISDSYDLKEVGGVVFEADCAMIELGAVSVNTGANASAEEAEEALDDDVVKVNNIETLLPNFKDWEFYTGESMNPDGAIVLMNYREDGVTPYIVVFKHGLKEEKV
ncbi:hypothetical protein BN1723_004410 [Verticillium longisporum]|uniref:Translationally-controlled tumor protein homolog n=1 Tax=Verticillium longisporum TaxID=100787 RepID=A0A0G4MV20_VERLO|nr:hypothetical protein BN1723_004410 [Verticillium longisporum]